MANVGIVITNSIIRIEIAKTGFAAIISVTTYYEFLVMSQYMENNNLN